VPHRRDRVHHHVAVFLVRKPREQHPDAEVEAVQHYIHHDREQDDDGPQQRQVDAHQCGSPGTTRPEGNSFSGAADSGREGVRAWPGPPSTGSCASPVAGPLAMIFKPYQVPAPNTVKYTTTKIASVNATGPAPCGDTASL